MGRKVCQETYVNGKFYPVGSEMDDEAAEQVRNKRIFEERETVMPLASQGPKVQAVKSEPDVGEGLRAKPRVPKSQVTVDDNGQEKNQPATTGGQSGESAGRTAAAAPDPHKRANR